MLCDWSTGAPSVACLRGLILARALLSAWYFELTDILLIFRLDTSMKGGDQEDFWILRVIDYKGAKLRHNN